MTQTLVSHTSVPSEIARSLLWSAIRIRMIEEEISARYHEAKMRCPVHLSTGQEGVSAAVGLALRKDDLAMSTHRAHGHYLGKGGDLKGMIAEIYGKKTGCASGKGGSMHLLDLSVGFMGSSAIVGGTIPIGVGLGLSIQLRKTDQISCVFLGDGAIEEGVFYESANFAALRKLPVLFLCENNLYSVYSPLKVRQPEGRKIHELVQAMGIPSKSGDGNNLIQTYQMISEAADKIRQGHGPQFLELSCYRWREHCGPNFDNDIGYRTEDEYLEWKRLDPIESLKTTLLSNGTLQEAEIEKGIGEINNEIKAAFEFAEDSAFPDPEEAFTKMYAEESGATL